MQLPADGWDTENESVSGFFLQNKTANENVYTKLLTNSIKQITNFDMADYVKTRTVPNMVVIWSIQITATTNSWH